MALFLPELHAMTSSSPSTSSPSAPRVTWEVSQHIAVVYLNRPDKLNGLDRPMFQQLIQCARDIRRDRSIRVVILAARGDSFCAGLDFSAVSKDRWMIPNLLLKWPWSKTNLAQQIAMCWRDLPVPVIAVVHGNCFGGGLQMALAADFRFADVQTRFSIMEMKWGLIPDMSILTSLTNLTRQDIAKELTMTGRVFDAAEAQSYGLVTQVSETPMDAAMALAQKLAQQSPDAIVATKRLFNQGWKRGEWSALRLERWLQYGLLGRKNQQIAMKNGLNKGSKEPRPFEPRR
ncbi:MULTISPECIES: crotonase/enoyl-CoA hydratase family protein [unclassified Oceanobacter]|uniref:crotonase/enoyl-CoA hydratase family protein n=1 Tax=unclassified Oceanobacter TaxID=2620260 RepID=UPI0027324377|nr:MULTISPECIES: crotonase/enoyl-CoA hydratase family protein [unclassified Oceanobacter]MDP2610424.1 crotonase/enoyl-CoA hydratase family protein [Oceanobacter sp. 1_MG-2023]MDP2613660.1 crotonase/enoyl-CoA hydratase family protein [Oceanobacter sp. 2_MG-2023]